MKKIISFYFDGTWNDPESKTNVRIMYELTYGYEIYPNQRKEKKYKDKIDGASHLKYYDKGVGTKIHDRIRGGVLGIGVKKNVAQAYDALVRCCGNTNDEVIKDTIYLFGFSRGAYTARLLSSILNKYGIQKEVTGKDLINAHFKKPKIIRGKSINIKFLGIWDTVVANGNPFSEIKFDPDNLRNKIGFTNLELSDNVEYASHALAIDEHRVQFKQLPLKESIRYPGRVEECWFVGSHSNVGGGYRDNYLNLISCQWMQERALSLGMRFYESIQVDNKIYEEPVVDSYDVFLKPFGWIKFFTKRFYRNILIEEIPYQYIHPSVSKYINVNGGYRPKNIPCNVVNKKIKINIHS